MAEEERKMKVLQFGLRRNERTERVPDRYGEYWWGVGLNDGREMHMRAQEVQVGPNGELIARRDNGHPMMILAAGAWAHCYAASMIDDGAPVCVEFLMPLPGPEDAA